MKLGLLSLVSIFQVALIIGGFIAYQQMAKMLTDLWRAYAGLVLETKGIFVDPGITFNPFAPLLLLVLLGLFSTLVLLNDEVRHKNVED